MPKVQVAVAPRTGALFACLVVPIGSPAGSRLARCADVGGRAVSQRRGAPAASEGAWPLNRVTAGAIYYPPAGMVARLLARFDTWLARRTTIGAAFIALSAIKPGWVIRSE